MSIEEGAVLVCGALAVLPLVSLFRRNWLMATAIVAVCSVIAVAAWPFASQRWTSARISASPPANRPIAEAGHGFVSSKTCRACHPHEYATWHGSYHRTMTQVASEESVVGDFAGSVASFNGHNYRFFRRDGQFFAEVSPSIDGTKSREEYTCLLTTGSHHMQVYWVNGGQGRGLSKLPLAYLFSEARWVPFDSTFLRPPGAETGRNVGEWNTTCIYCHTTHPQPRLKFTKEGTLERSDLYEIDTRVGEFGIACEACHGPSREHVLEARSPWKRYRLHAGDSVHEDTVQPEELPASVSSQICGSCHSVTVPQNENAKHLLLADGYGYRPGDDLFDRERSDRVIVQTHLAHPSIREALGRESNFLATRFWSDGMIRVSGREFNGLIESPCYTHGDEERGVLSCMSCHQMHQQPGDSRSRRQWADDQLKIGMRGDQACKQCHDGYTDDREIEAHTHHPAQQAGSRCYNCHMPHTTYGLLKAIRSHTVSSPSVQESLQTGRPNACNLCHLDKSLGWTAEHLAAWYGIERPDLLEDEREIAASVLWALRGDAGQRALIAWGMGWPPARQASGEDWLPSYLAQLMTDPYDAVRYIAYHSLLRLPGFEVVKYDFMKDADRRDIVQRVRRIRLALRSTRHEPRHHLLLGLDGEIDRPALTRQLQQRDTRHVLLNE